MYQIIKVVIFEMM